MNCKSKKFKGIKFKINLARPKVTIRSKKSEKSQESSSQLTELSEGQKILTKKTTHKRRKYTDSSDEDQVIFTIKKPVPIKIETRSSRKRQHNLPPTSSPTAKTT